MNTDPVSAMHTWAPVMALRLGSASCQGGVALALVGGACRAFPALPPRVRCWLWRLAYLKLLAALLWSTPVALPLLPAPPAAVDSGPASVAMDTPEGERTRRSEIGGREPAIGLETTLSSRSRPFVPRRAPAVFAPGRTIRTRIHSELLALSPRKAPDLTGWLLLLWMAGAGLTAVGVGRDWYASRGLAGGAALAADPWLLECCAALGRRFRLRRCPRVLLSDAAGSPVLVGACRPALILPPSLLTVCDRDEVQAILAHELAHLKRGDLLWAWLPTLARALFFFHPLVWLGQREWRLAQEICCDELAVLVTPVSALEYGQVVLKVAARRRSDRCREPLAVGVVGSYQSLRRRLVALQQIRPISRRRGCVIGALLAAAGTMLIVPWHVTAQAAPRRFPGRASIRSTHRASGTAAICLC
jgi:beta-lactamase regulating signal transducer with metallopeptidase domain